MKKQIWGKFFLGEGIFVLKGKEVPMRIMIQLPYNWHLSHDGKAVKKYWAMRRKRKNVQEDQGR